MFRNKDVLLIKNIDSEYIDKIIVILNEKHKNVISEEHIIKQAEKIVEEYSDKHLNLKVMKFKKTMYNLAFIGLISTILIYLIYNGVLIK